MKDIFIDLAKYRIQRAFENRTDAAILLKSDNIVDAVNRIYLANYYAVKSLLATKMKDSSKHQKVLNMFHEEFVQTGEVPKEYGLIVDRSYSSRDDGGERHEELQISEKEARSMIEESKRFLEFVRTYLQQLIIANPVKSSELVNGEKSDREKDDRNGK